LIENKIGTLVIGKNKEWKQEINIGTKNNQSFTMIPHARFIDLITYKFEAIGGIVNWLTRHIPLNVVFILEPRTNRIKETS
jgi:IS605 OrfB family transposase